MILIMPCCKLKSSYIYIYTSFAPLGSQRSQRDTVFVCVSGLTSKSNSIHLSRRERERERERERDSSSCSSWAGEDTQKHAKNYFALLPAKNLSQQSFQWAFFWVLFSWATMEETEGVKRTPLFLTSIN